MARRGGKEERTPLPETSFLHLDLLGEPLAKLRSSLVSPRSDFTSRGNTHGLLLLLELGVLDLLDLGLAASFISHHPTKGRIKDSPELARLHLRLAVVLVVRLLRRSDQVEHVRANEQ